MNPLLNITANDNIGSELISFQPKRLAKIEECMNKGKFRIIGTFDGIFEENNFEFPLSYPSVNVKCKVEEAEEDKEVEIICKLQKELKDIKSLAIESRIVTKRHKEILFINNFNNIIFENISMSCENYNRIKFNKAIRNQRANFTFLTISNFNPSVNSRLFANFFITMEKNPNESFAEIKIPINAKYSMDSKNQFGELEISKSTNCSIAIQKRTIVVYECISETELPSEPSKISIDYDNVENIAGLPESVDPSKLNFNLDYSNRNNLDIINNIPVVDITSIKYLHCNDYGSFTIEGKIKKGKFFIKYGVEIQFSFPDTIFICEIESKPANIIMNCKNEDKFPISPIMFDKTYVKDTDGTILFKLNNYIYQKQFACDDGIIYSSQRIDKNKNKFNIFNIFKWIIIGLAILLVIIFIIFIIKKKIIPKPSPEDTIIPKIPKPDTNSNASHNCNSNFYFKVV